MSVVSAVERAIASIADADPTVAALGEIAIALARDADDGSNSATQRAGASRALADVLVQLRELAPAPKGGDRLDELARARDARRSG